jgi:cell division protein ZapE
MGHGAPITSSTSANAYAEFGRTESRLIEMQSEEYLALEHRAG